jgi:foldase protein PrsA
MRYFTAVIALALLAGACSGGSAAATVNGVDIDTATLDNIMVVPDQDLTDAQVRAVLTALIQWAASADAARDEFGIDPTEAEIADYQEVILADTGLSREDYLSGQQISELGFELFAKQLMVGEGVVAVLEEQVDAPTEEEAQQMLDDDPASWTTVCASHILVSTQDEADGVLGRLDAGEDFSALATELSLDAQSSVNGGDLGCSSPATYVPEFADATMTGDIGAVTGPVETQFGFHLIRVDSRTEATPQEVIDTLSQSQLSNLVNEWYLTSISAAEITVNPEYGTWQTDPTPTIVAPAS